MDRGSSSELKSEWILRCLLAGLDFAQNTFKMKFRNGKITRSHVNLEPLNQEIASTFHNCASLHTIMILGGEYTMPSWAVCSAENLEMVAVLQSFCELDGNEMHYQLW